MRFPAGVLALLAAIAAGSRSAVDVGRMFAYFQGTDYLNSFGMLALFWPGRSYTWLALAAGSLVWGAIAFWWILRRAKLAGSPPSTTTVISFLLVVPLFVMSAAAYLTIPVAEFLPYSSGVLFLGLSVLTTGMAVRKVLLRRASIKLSRVLTYLVWAYLPTPVLISVAGRLG